MELSDDVQIECKQPATLVCFAVRQEARPFKRLIGSRPDVRVLMTGMGQRNAEKAIRAALAIEKPARVFTCGFAGGLNPELKTGDVVFLTAYWDIDKSLVEAGARPVSFFYSPQVVSTRVEKEKIWREKHVGAVEMESHYIQEICREQAIPCATVRVILDTANEDLPLDFNALMTPDMRMDFWKLYWTLVKSPGKVPALMRLGKQSKAAAQKLAALLHKIVTA